jgi:hypothetical protein
MSDKTPDETRNTELRSRRDAYASKTARDDAETRDFQHFQRLANRKSFLTAAL